MKSIVVLLLAIPLFGQVPAGTNVQATAQCESLDSDVLGITSLQICDVGFTNFSNGTIVMSEAEVRGLFPTLDIENSARALAVADTAFNGSKKSKGIAAFNFISPLLVGVMGGGVINFGVRAALKAVTWTSLTNSTLQAFKTYLVGLQPNKSSFLSTLPSIFTLTPYGTAGFSVVYTVLGSLSYTNSQVTPLRASKLGLRGRAPGTTIVVNVNLPVVPTPGSPGAALDSPTAPAVEAVTTWTHPAIEEGIVAIHQHN